MSLILLSLIAILGFFALFYGFLLQVRRRIMGYRDARLQAATRSGMSSTSGGSGVRSGKRMLKVVIVHMSLFIGGAERLIVDVALALKYHQRKVPMEVVIVTTEHPRERCFKETIDGSLKVEVCGSFLPRKLFGKGVVFFSTLRMWYAGLVACWVHPDVDCFFVDDAANLVPLLRFLACNIPIIFYCHFPSLLCDSNRVVDEAIFSETSLEASTGGVPPGAPQSAAFSPWQRSSGDGVAVKRLSLCHKIYCDFFDWAEEWSLRCATSIVCNSKFTRMVTLRVFPTLAGRIDERDIFYPPVALPAAVGELKGDSPDPDIIDVSLAKKLEEHTVFFSINRYNPKKNIGLALQAFALLLKDPSELEGWAKPPLLVIAGGYNSDAAADVAYMDELHQLAFVELRLPRDRVFFLYNIRDEVKSLLLRQMRVLLYTPSNEHFGIGPLEGMVLGKPVIAVALGGPLESIGTGDDAAGVLCAPQPEAFAAAMRRLGGDDELCRQLGERGKRRVAEIFSMDAFAERLVSRVHDLCAREHKKAV
ncbi:unnamed protein product [Phytomonas sp. EM1]|nr:unnamed protein product [Phytomonas sp. EM1]|eukprot:CCW60641.1 unnamed protein product [Phytomonas sp. isolate EM1]